MNDKLPSQEDYVLLHKVLRANKARFSRIEKEKEDIEKELEKVARMIRDGEDVNRIIGEIPVYVEDQNEVYDINGVGTNDRRAHVYRNAHNRMTWGLQLSSGVLFRDKVEIWCGAMWPTRQAVVKWANRWVAYGQSPANRLCYFKENGKRG
mgnify:CR=1 FL=1